jgi:hypothetical protein
MNKINPTPYHDLNFALSEMVDGIQSILGEKMIGAYLQGSFAVGDFDLHSDVDWIVALEDELTTDEVAALQANHRRVYDLPSRWAKHLEGSYFPKAILKSAPEPKVDLWYLDNGSRTLERSDHCNTLVVRWVVRQWGIPMAGPSPETLINPIDVDALRHEIYETMNTWGQQILDKPEVYNNRFYQAYLVLNFARMLRDLIFGQCGSKLAGAEWMIYGAAPQWAGLIERSWARRINPANSVSLPADQADYALTLDFLRYVLEQSQQHAPSRELTE